MELSLNDILQVRQEFSEMKIKFDEMYSCLIGNKISGDGGLVKQIVDNKIMIEKLEGKIEALEKKNTKSETYVKIIWTLAGFIGASLWAYILRLIFHS